MHRGILSALQLAALADLLPVRVERPGVRERLGFFEIGPSASDDEIATIACRALVRRKGRFSEERVRRTVEHHGFRYAPLSGSRDLGDAAAE
jgi:hypothetical protein